MTNPVVATTTGLFLCWNMVFTLTYTLNSENPQNNARNVLQPQPDNDKKMQAIPMVIWMIYLTIRHSLIILRQRNGTEHFKRAD